MKTFFFLIVSALALTASSPVSDLAEPNNNLEINSAISEGKIKVTAIGNEESPHYYQPILLGLKNLTNKTLVINIQNGQLFKSTDPDFQDIIVTQDEMITLKSFESISKPIFGMCVQASNTAPGNEQEYSLDKMATGNLATMAKKIEEKEAYSIAGQNSVWAVTDNNELSSIDSFNPEEAADLREYVANLLSITDTITIVGDRFVLDTGPITVSRTVGGNFKYRFSKTSAVSIGMFNDQNIVVKELYNNPETPAGEHKLAYEFDTMVFPDEAYYIRLIIDGQIKINFKMEPRRG